MTDKEIRKMAQIISQYIIEGSSEWVRPKQVFERYSIKTAALNLILKRNPHIRKMKTGTSHSSALLINVQDLEQTMIKNTGGDS